jgi:uncharacterized membrane protein YdbT with pleckstrin-like domain
MDPNSLSHIGKNLFKLIEFDEQERLIWEVRKHPVGLFIIYASGTLIALLMLVIFVVGGAVAGENFLDLGIDISGYRAVLIFAGLIMGVLTIGVTAIAGYLYKNNVMLVTTDKIAQVLYRTLFDRKISQLSIGDVQDVTVTQKGVLARMFNYGTVVIETAGEQQNYTFTFVPDPYMCSKAIVGAHEDNLKSYGN